MIAKTEITEQPEFHLAGISVRTINQNGQSKKDMMALWDRFMNHTLRQIADRVSGGIYCVYTDYETDHTGYYTAVIGCKVDSLVNIPDGLTGITIPAEKYNVYTLGGKCPANVYAAWGEIWESDVDRKYTTDFDLYKLNIANFEDTEVKIFVAVK